jgi:hypothetical protein
MKTDETPRALIESMRGISRTADGGITVLIGDMKTITNRLVSRRAVMVWKR